MRSRLSRSRIASPIEVAEDLSNVRCVNGEERRLHFEALYESQLLCGRVSVSIEEKLDVFFKLIGMGATVYEHLLYTSTCEEL